MNKLTTKMQKFLYGQENSKIIIFFNIHFIIFGYYNEDYKLKLINLINIQYIYYINIK